MKKRKHGCTTLLRGNISTAQGFLPTADLSNRCVGVEIETAGVPVPNGPRETAHARERERERERERGRARARENEREAESARARVSERDREEEREFCAVGP